MGLFFYTKIGSIIFIGDLPTTNIIEPKNTVAKSTPNYHSLWAVVFFSSKIEIKR